MPILPTLHGPADLRGLTEAQLEELAAEIRETIIATVSSTGRPPRQLARRRRAHDRAPPAARIAARPDRLGHRPPGLPAQAPDRPLRAVRDAPPARRGGRLPASDASRSTTSSTAATPAPASRSARASRPPATCATACERIAVVVGDAAITSGLSLEALNDIGQRKTQLLIVLNDNEMSISPTVGALSTYLSQIKLSGTWQASKTASTTSSSARSRSIGPTVRELGQRLRALGRELRPGRAGCSRISGSPTSASCRATTSRRCSRRSPQALELPGPVIVHVRTQKGRGFKPAEADQVGFHGAALPPMSVPNAGRTATAVGADDADRVDGRRRRAADGRPPPSRRRRTRTTPRSSSPS